MSRSGHTAAPPELGAITFDLDGLLVESETLWFQAERAHMELYQET